MNRLIKFRAWDKKKKKMIYDDNDGIFITLMGEIGSMDFYLPDGGISWGEEFNPYILMQFTGLLDKNGKEIYFGDILATSNYNPEHDIWSKEDSGYTVVRERVGRLGVSFSNWGLDTEDEDSIYHTNFVEIIGNIYEHKHLLDNTDTKG